jgi:low affinity Fe/Cu permease
MLFAKPALWSLQNNMAQSVFHKIHRKLTKWLNNLAQLAGHPLLFAGLVALALTWFVAGIFFQFDDVWYNILDVFVFMTTFFLVFVVQASQNTDTEAMQDKLDEIIRALDDADSKKVAEEKPIKRGEKRGKHTV